MQPEQTQSADGAKPWWCYICSFEFPDRASAQAHVAGVHGQIPVADREQHD